MCSLLMISIDHCTWISRLTVGTATSTVLASICCTTRGHSEWALIPTQPCCGGKHSFLLVSADKQQQALLRVTCRQPNQPLGSTRNVVGYVAPRRATAHYGCARGCDCQHRHQVAVTSPVGWIWGFKLLKGGVSGLDAVCQPVILR